MKIKKILTKIILFEKIGSNVGQSLIQVQLPDHFPFYFFKKND